MKNIGPSSRGAVIDQVFSSGKAFHPGSDALRSLPRTGMFAEQPETVTDLVDDTVCDLQTRAFRPIGKNLFEIALRRRYMQHLQKNGGYASSSHLGTRLSSSVLRAFSAKGSQPSNSQTSNLPTVSSLLPLFCRFLHQERFTSLLQSSASTLFLKNAGVQGGYNRKFLKDYLKSIAAEPPLRL